ncbi:hypothetical protein J2T12_001181 [Paenibacillus anaericanus]|uniref:hypothetical protein n=1 Tax=Paenibacillus anaericanus TaxID=170367 RepID=UPI002789A1F2|nr:hypothetical protein [Paenibacillus anaericanus]MDQ0087775.1 hypothetical protein [Paenibacillus anaericanus]
MKRWIFAGISDKRDLLLYLCKLLTVSKYRVLLTDATEGRRYSYSIGNLDPTLQLTEFCGFDVTTGLSSTELWEEELTEAGKHSAVYDYMLLDMDSLMLSSIDPWLSADEILWVTSFDRYEVERSSEWFRRLFLKWPELQGMKVRPLYIRTVESNLNEEYIMGFMEDLPIVWNEDPIWIPWNENNMAIQLENEHSNLLRMNRISRSYQRALVTLLQQLVGLRTTDVRRAFRQAKRREA